MNNIQQQTQTLLHNMARQFREVRLLGDIPQLLDRLADQVDQPCVLAVVGRVKAGKSSFVNALLGEDLAMVGTTETTATINYFRYGIPNPARPVRCHWRNGQVTEEPPDFPDRLQGNDPETLRRADAIAVLEYFLPNPRLQHVTLVDTPGMNAIVDEHQNRTAEYLNLQNQLRARRHQETERIGAEADAVIYLVGAVARQTDQEFLEEFGTVTGHGQSRTFNALGVLAKIDLFPQVLEQRHRFAAGISSRLRDSLNTVVPVSAGLYRAFLHLTANDAAALKNLMAVLKQIPAGRLKMMLDNEQFFTRHQFPDCPVPAGERKLLIGDMPWRVFVTIAHLIRNSDSNAQEIAAKINELAGFEPLQRKLESLFFRRSHFLRCFRILNDAYKLLSSVKYSQLPQIRQKDEEYQARKTRYIEFIRESNGNPQVGRELEALISLQFDVLQRATQIESLVQQFDFQVSLLRNQVLQHNADSESLQLMNDHPDQFSETELIELQHLFGLYGLETERRLPGVEGDPFRLAHQCQLRWRKAELTAPAGSCRRLVAEQAQTRYGLILNEILQSGGNLFPAQT